MLRFVCRNTVEEISHYEDGQMHWFRRLQMNVHLLICVWCRRFSKQFRLATEAAAHEARQPASGDDVNKVMQQIDATPKD